MSCANKTHMRTVCSVGTGFEMTKRQSARYDWKRSLTPSEQKEYDKYLKRLRELHPNNTWRDRDDKRYYRACKDGFMQRHYNLDNFVREEPPVQPSKD